MLFRQFLCAQALVFLLYGVALLLSSKTIRISLDRIAGIKTQSESRVV